MALIYLIDDDEDFRFLVTWTLELAGHRGLAFASSDDALTSLTRTPAVPPLVLMDYKMPGLSAADFIGELRRERRWRATRVVLVSGVDDLKRTAQSIGADGFLPKPFDLPDIEKVLVAHLNAP